MKLISSAFTIVAINFLYFFAFSLATLNKKDVSYLTERYNVPKNIGFSAIFGGSSHIKWVLVILEELHNRGHNVSFIAKDGDLHNSKYFSGINTFSSGPDLEFDDKNLVFTALEEGASDIKMKFEMATSMKKSWSKDYLTMLDFIKSNNIDLMLCDHFSEACVDASRKVGIPFIVTSVLEMTRDSDAPYVNVLGMTVDDFSTEYQSIYKRFKDRFIEPFEILATFKDLFNEIVILKKTFGVDTPLDPSEAWKDSIKLVNSFYGITAPRPLGSLVEQVGPIIPRSYASLTDSLKRYLKNHKRVAYISFGQHATPSKNTIRLLLISLLENYESGDIDGILWAIVHSQNAFPDFVTTSSNTTYSTREIFDGKYADLRFEKWVPQMALLLHPSTHIFISHGGFGSCIEAMFAGVRMILFPSYADQFGNAKSLERGNLGVSVRTPIYLNELTSTIKRVVSDKDGKIKDSLKRMQAIVQIRSRNGPTLAADVVEEVVFSHVKGKIPHRYAASRRLSFLRAHNLDLYIILITIFSITLFSMGFFITKIVKTLKITYKVQKKLKVV